MDIFKLGDKILALLEAVLYSLDYKIGADYEMMVRLFFKIIFSFLATFRFHARTSFLLLQT